MQSTDLIQVLYAAVVFSSVQFYVYCNQQRSQGSGVFYHKISLMPGFYGTDTSLPYFILAISAVFSISI